MSLIVPGGTITAGTGITATTGNIVASSGNVTASSGSITGSTGTFTTLNVTGITYSNQPYYYVLGTTSQSIAHNTNTTLSTYWNGTPSSSNITYSSGVFTVVYSGLYFVFCSTNWGAFAAPNPSQNILKNNTTSYGTSVVYTSTRNITSAIIPMAASDNIRISVYQNNGTPQNIITDGVFYMYKIN
jgi:hypothetical protein